MTTTRAEKVRWSGHAAGLEANVEERTRQLLRSRAWPDAGSCLAFSEAVDGGRVSGQQVTDAKGALALVAN